MQTRREILAIGAGLMFAAAPLCAHADSFDTLLQQIIANPELAQQAKAGSDGPQNEFNLRSDRNFVRAFAPRLKASKRKISTAAQDLIIACEVSSPAVYQRAYQKPVWPGADSGVTIAVGYDLGFIKPDWLHEDWDGLIDPATLKALLPACQLRGPQARDFCARNSHIQVPWTNAQAQFQAKLLPRFIEETLLALPRSASLSGDSLGALVSLVYNRGSSFRNGGPRYTEMRQIYSAVQLQNLPTVPEDFLRMRRLWPTLPGLQTRRAAEAALFKRGLGVV